MPQGFTFIDQYQNLSKTLEHESCDGMMSLDQEIPQTRGDFDGVLQSEPKLEKVEMDAMAFMGFLNSQAAELDTPTPECPAPASWLSDYSNSPPSLFSVVPESMTSFSSPQSLSPTSSPSTFIRTYNNNSGCRVVSSSSPSSVPSPSPSAISSSSSTISASPTPPPALPLNFLGEDMFSVSQEADSTLEYLDLDKPVSFYSGYDALDSPQKSLGDEQESVPLEDAVIFMRDVIHQDCMKLNVPHDPVTWSCDQVQRWVRWVCSKNGFRDISCQMSSTTGRALCEMSPAFLCECYGSMGSAVSNELELWKAANSCFPEETHPSHMGNLRFDHVTPSVSPAPSSCSSGHMHSDSSEDESTAFKMEMTSSTPNTFFNTPTTVSSSSGNSSSSNSSPTLPRPTGRGHKHTTHLWQFLRELLLSGDNFSDCIRWLDRKSGIFKIEDSKKVATLWGERKNRPAMNYDKLSRSVRQYYKKGIIKKTEQSKRLVYQFCSGYL